MKMKIHAPSRIGGVLIFSFLGIWASAQSEKEPLEKNSGESTLRVKQMTIMERYEPQLILSKEERLKMKRERLAFVQERRNIIDTLDISDNKRRRLLKELYIKADDDLWNRVVADLEFEEDPEDPDR